MATSATAILKSCDFLPATEVAKLAGFSASNLACCRISGNGTGRSSPFSMAERIYLPHYGLDPGDHRPRKELAESLKVFGDAKDGWGLAFWFAGLNSFLDDERPKDVLATDPEQVIAAVRDEMAEIEHG